MWNVDTLSLVMNLKNRGVRVSDKSKGAIHWRYVWRVDKKIRNKLRYYRQNNSRKYGYRYISNNSSENRGKFVAYKGYNFWYNLEAYALTVILSHDKVEAYTADEILQHVNQVIMEYFELEEHELNAMVLTRIDIKCDYRFADNEEYKIIKNIISKASQKTYHYKKEPVTDTDKEYSVKWLARKTKKDGTEYNEEKVTVDCFNVEEDSNVEIEDKEEGYYIDEDSSDYFEFIIYDKFKEQLAKERYGQLSRYKNIIRTEVKIKNGNLNSQKFQGVVTNKHLHTFYNPVKTTELYSKYAERLFGSCEFYRIDVALSIIENATNIKPKMKSKLCELLILVNEVGYTTAKEQWICKYCISTFNTHKARIELLGINILTFDEKINGEMVQREHINNFTLLKNSVPEQKFLW